MPHRVDFHVLSRFDAEQYEPRGVEACISIGDPEGVPARLSGAFVAVLRLEFNDIVSDPAPTDVLFAIDHASEILQFVERCPQVDRIMVHCGAGVSRSPGVALGVSDAFGWPCVDLEHTFPAWNRRVRSVIADYAVRRKK